jgi:hypothetical protein
VHRDGNWQEAVVVVTVIQISSKQWGSVVVGIGTLHGEHGSQLQCKQEVAWLWTSSPLEEDVKPFCTWKLLSTSFAINFHLWWCQKHRSNLMGSKLFFC